MKLATVLIFMAGMIWNRSSFATEQPSSVTQSDLLAVHSLTVGDKAIPLGREGTARLDSYPQNITFTFGATTNAARVPVRLRYKLEGYDTDWRENAGTMNLAVRFYDEAGDQVSQ